MTLRDLAVVNAPPETLRRYLKFEKANSLLQVPKATLQQDAEVLLTSLTTAMVLLDQQIDQKLLTEACEHLETIKYPQGVKKPSAALIELRTKWQHNDQAIFGADRPRLRQACLQAFSRSDRPGKMCLSRTPTDEIEASLRCLSAKISFVLDRPPMTLPVLQNTRQLLLSALGEAAVAFGKIPLESAAAQYLELSMSVTEALLSLAAIFDAAMCAISDVEIREKLFQAVQQQSEKLGAPFTERSPADKPMSISASAQTSEAVFLLLNLTRQAGGRTAA